MHQYISSGGQAGRRNTASIPLRQYLKLSNFDNEEILKIIYKYIQNLNVN